MDGFSREVLSGRWSKTREVACCREAMEDALAHSCPGISNSDQGSPFTSQACTSRLKQAAVCICMERVKHLAWMKAALQGISPVVIGMAAMAVIRMFPVATRYPT